MAVISRIFGYFEEGVLNLLITLMTLLVFSEVVALILLQYRFSVDQELTLTFAVGLCCLVCLMG